MMEREDVTNDQARGSVSNLKACGRQLSASELAFLEAIIGRADSIKSEDVPEFARLVSSVQSCLLGHAQSNAESSQVA